VNICSVIAKNYVAHARVLADSFRATHPDGVCSVVVVDDIDGAIDGGREPFEVLRLDEIGLPDAERMAASYDVLEFSTAVKPWLLAHLLDRPGVDAVTYLDPDIRVYSLLEEIERRAQRHGVVLTPHFTTPLPRDGRKPSEEDILIAGAYNLGFIAVAAGKTTTALLDWWSERLESHCIVDPAAGRFVDQRWIDLAPGLWEDIDVLRDPGYNTAYWNLPSRRLEEGADGYSVDGRPLRFFHFSGFDPRYPDRLSKHQDRIEVGADPVLTKICSEYARELLDHGFEEARRLPYGWKAMANGLELSRPLRGLHREAAEKRDIEDSVFTDGGAEQFVSLLNRTENGGALNGSLSRYWKTLWESRPDLQTAFPDVEGADAPAFAQWMHNHASQEEIAAGLVQDPASPTAPPISPVALQKGVNLVGYLSSKRGVGEAARQVHSALEAGGVATKPIDIPTDATRLPAAMGRLRAEDYPYDINLICVNADMLPAVAAAAGARFFGDRHSVGLWFWEVSAFPEHLQPAFDSVDEVWVATEHIADAVRPVSPVPVRTVRLPIEPAPPAEMSREQLAMPEGFCFLFVYDYRSVFRRKNPLGVVSAFCEAFEPGVGASLVIKSVSAEEFPAERQRLAEAVVGRPEIHLIEETVPPAAKNAMIAGCDCYVSLHRSEGLGLTMAEAMYYGRPVIATAYSGNLDFMTEENSFLVRHRMAPIGEDAAPYPPSGEWAEPDLAHAASLMRQVFEQPDLAARRGRRAAADIRRTHSVAAARESVVMRVEEVRRERLAARLRRQAAPPLDLAEPPPPGRLRAKAKSLYFRALRPYASRQQVVNAAAATSLDELRDLVAETLELQAAGARDARERGERNREELMDWTATTEEALEELRRRADAADDLVAASHAKPFMADGRLGPRAHPALGATLGFLADAAGEGGYRGFEDIFRGSEEMIRDRQRVYLQLVADRPPVLDAGCGRGEFLDLLAERGIEHQAVDLDPEMVARAREKGHRVEEGDLVDFLEATPVGSLGTVFSAQVAEHLEPAQLQRFLGLALSRLRPGGLLVVETVNPHSPAALKTFWVDPTHVQPLFPETLLALCRLSGYAAGDVFAPEGSGDWERDRTSAGEYAMVAVAPGA
jgi:SAM-dependent methyltransferase/glycosyltransferase involved in cell wall biosynthesis